MKQFWALNKRNIKLYFKDHSAVFFSLLSMLIVIMLMVFFLGNMANASILNAVKDIPGRDLAADTLRVKEMVYLWTVAGIITINAASVTHSFYTNMIKDRGDNKLNSILVMPIKRSHITASFVFGAWFVSVIMGCLTLLVTQIIGVMRGFEVLSLLTILKVFLIICLNAFVYASIMFFFASIVKSDSAWGAIGIIIGTLSGFLGGIYLSVGDLSEGVVKVLKCFPFIYGTSALREVMLDATEDVFFEGTPEIIRESVDAAMGNSLTLFEKELLGAGKIGILLLVGLGFMFLSTLIITFSKKKDR